MQWSHRQHTTEGRETATDCPIIWSNGCSYARFQIPGLLCISSFDDWPMYIPHPWSQLKAPSVEKFQHPGFKPQCETHKLLFTHQFTAMDVVFSLFLPLMWSFLLFFPFSVCDQATRPAKWIPSPLCCHALWTQFLTVRFQVLVYILNNWIYWKYAVYFAFNMWPT